jgi:hypothetical protein
LGPMLEWLMRTDYRALAVVTDRAPFLSVSPSSAASRLPLEPWLLHHD